jgi:RND family efflux transporter MFP subunit
MNQRAEILEKLRIDRGKGDQPSSRATRWTLMLIIGAALAIVATGVTLFISSNAAPARAQTSTATAKPPPDSNHGNVVGGSILEASGYVVALREATVSGKSIYRVSEVLVQEGQAVSQGEIIARLDDTNIRAALIQSRAQVKQLQAALAAARMAADDARPIFLRNQRQLSDGLISQDTFDAAKASYDAVTTAVSVAEQNLEVAKAAVDVNLRYQDDTVIKAPFDGVVTVKTAQPGEVVSPQFSGGGGIAKIVDMGSLEVDVDVSENFIHRVHPDQPATITLNAYPDWRIPAAVIAVIPTADRAKATVKVRVGFKKSDSRIVPEMGARVSFLNSTQQEPPVALAK